MATATTTSPISEQGEGAEISMPQLHQPPPLPILRNASTVVNDRPLALFQLLCLFGYTLAIPSIGIFLLQILEMFTVVQHSHHKMLITMVFGFIYPSTSALKMLSHYLASDKYFLVAFPILLFYTTLSLYLYTFA